jgi:hypothetical protein
VTDNVGDNYLRFECPNCPSESRSKMECRRLMGGISQKTIENYDFKVPFVDIRHCPTCSIFWKITIESPKHPVKYEQFDGAIPFVYFKNLTCVDGRKIKRP